MAIYPYKTTPLTDFSNEANIRQYQKALEEVRVILGKTYPLIIGGKDVMTERTMASVNPANTKEVIGTLSQAGVKEADMALENALRTFETWKRTPASTRADVLFKAANIIKRRRFFFNALMTKEAGKPWPEADADTAEAIDFLEYYGRQMLELERIDDKVLSRPDLERNNYFYIPLGVGAIIPPWNFPLAILAGMTSAAVVTGNTVLLKPASTTQVIGYHFVKVMEEAGLPAGVINFVPGKGSEIGEYIINHPKIRFISFTGSKDVGVHIYERAAIVQKNQVWLKRVIAEMGGKDAIIVDGDADLDLAAESIVKSAFGFSGQKCSACSRAIIVETVYDTVVNKIRALTEQIKVGNPEDFQTFMGPLNDEGAFKKVTDYIKIGFEEGKLVTGGTSESKTGWFVRPTVFKDLDPNARLMQEEVFGPVLALAKVKDFDEAIEVANNTDYGLTGGVISNNRAHLEKARADFHVGNLYFNRKCTGAIVGYQPFGGFNLSGTDSKAGGPDYLVLHMQGKSVTEQY
jgi:1-pyrroline-5-carboxylate dehydrogenase